jgi:ABC-type multidrug transport system ATPase subunit
MKIEIIQVNKIYQGNIVALDEVNLSIPGGIFGLLGPNGAGKTTLMRILAGILSPSSGTIRVGEFDVTSRPGRAAIKQILGYLPQEPGLYPSLSAREFLDYIAILKGINNRQQRRTRVDELLEMVSLKTVATHKLKTFSRGMKQRIGIAQALLNNPQLLIVDEPTAGLDPEERIHFRNLLAELAGERTILLSTHIIEDIAQTCHNLALLKNGKVIFQGTTTEMIETTRGHVWQTTTTGPKPAGNFTVISTLNQEHTTQYRIVGEQRPDAQATLVEPDLEDCYIWFMQTQGDNRNAPSYR